MEPEGHLAPIGSSVVEWGTCITAARSAEGNASGARLPGRPTSPAGEHILAHQHIHLQFCRLAGSEQDGSKVSVTPANIYPLLCA